MDEQKIRERAYALWEEAGRPEGQQEEFWDRARELVAQEENLESTTIRNPLQAMTEPGPYGEPIEPAEAFENQGEFPGLADQGDESPAPAYRRRTKE